nr:MAG TPA: Protein C [Inoviridae sp.]
MKVNFKPFLNRFFRRVGALLSALFLSFSLMLPFASAASVVEAVMPSKADFLSHHGSWFCWRTRVHYGVSYFELCSSPIVFDSSGNLDRSASSLLPYKSSSYFDIGVISGSDLRYYYACALPVPCAGVSGLWSDLPSFPVGSSSSPNSNTCLVSLYSSTSYINYSYSVFLSPCSSLTPSSVFFSNSIGSSTDSISVSEFPSPLYSYPFAFRTDSSSTNYSYAIKGGNSSCIIFDNTHKSFISFDTSKFLVKPDSFSSYPETFSSPSSDLGLVVVGNPSSPSGGTINSASSFSPFTAFYLIPTLLVPVGMLPDVKLGDWVSDSPEDLQKALTNEFGIDSGTLKNSKDNLNSWNSTSSVDSDVASGASGLLNGIFQNLGTFLFSVSLLCFGAVVLRMLIRKAVDG